MCGISVSYLSRIETGDIQRPHDDVLAKIGQHLGIHMTEIRRLISAPTKNDLIIKSSEIREKLEKIAEDLESIRNALEKMTK
jgi:transcriptional regulator with XRE-family HTH domain